ncbi:MAG: Stp1/IreP family PP2C-type Ser/Thr phosphatase [Nitrospirales bacterium]
MTSRRAAGISGWVGAGLTDIGRVRGSNQDAFAVLNSLGVWIVADGMGGHAGGDVASRLAVDAVVRTIQASPLAVTATPNVARPDPGTLREALEQAVAAANQTIFHEAGRQEDLAGMGTTLVILHLTREPVPIATIAHVGDSRAYRFRRDALTQLTEDHAVVDEYRRQGLMSSAEAKRHPLRNALSRAVGTDPHVQPDIASFSVDPEDLFLLCTDGLTKMLEDDDIVSILRTPRPPQHLCATLVEAANQRGGEDNVTVVVVTRPTPSP